MNYTLIAAVILIDKQLTPPSRDRLGIDCKAVILCGDVATTCASVCTRLIVSSVTVTVTHNKAISILIVYDLQRRFHWMN